MLKLAPELLERFWVEQVSNIFHPSAGRTLKSVRNRSAEKWPIHPGGISEYLPRGKCGGE